MIYHNPKYILPTGTEWHGPVHQLPDGTWATGTVTNSASLPLGKIDEAWSFPRTGTIASQKIFKQVFSFIEKDSTSSESLVKDFNTKVSVLKELLRVTEEVLDSSLIKVKNYLNSKNIQTEKSGRGSLLSNCGFSLKEISGKDKTSLIESVKYIHDNNNNYFLWQGNIEAGILYNNTDDSNDVTECLNRKLYVEMVSRNGAALENIDPNDTLLNTTFSEGFNGKFVITLKKPTIITYVSLPNNTDKTAIILNESTSTEKNCFINTPFDSTLVSTITFKVENFIEPVPFESYFSLDYSDDYLGEGVVPGEKVKIYQRTRLEIGPVGISLKQYDPSTTFILGKDSPFTCSSGSLSSISFTADESINGSTPNDTSFKYYLILQNEEYEINPINRAGNKIHTYKINSSLSAEAKANSASGIKYIDLDTPPLAWKLKVVLSKSDESEASPILKDINFQYLTSLSGGINV